MKLDRNISSDGRGKYALVRLRTIEPGSEADQLLRRLDQLGVLDWGVVGQPDEFFIVKLRDRYATDALKAYAEAVRRDAELAKSDDEHREKMEWAIAVMSMLWRAGLKSPFCKHPD